MTILHEFEILEINREHWFFDKWLLNSNNYYSKNKLYHVLFSYYINF